ncbi:MAG: hypothetical protein QF595_05690 [Dehalococcoidia bacterium]|nr:hypothetical protein [Dehalococcoidia bacterium]
MNSYVTQDFLSCFQRLPDNIKEKARKNYRLWKENSAHPSLRFKRINSSEPIHSIRIGVGWRALGLRERNNIYWFWIGSHAEYDSMLRRF